MKKEKKPANPEKDEVREEEVDPTESEAAVPEKTSEELVVEYLDGWKRCQAEFENYKKRQAESRKELGGYLIEKLLQDIIPVLDNFRMATGHVPKEAEGSPWVTGIQYIEQQLENVLKGHGVEVIEVREGDAFDPSKMEAISSERETESEESSAGPSDNEAPRKKESDERDGESERQEEVVSKVLQNGYKVGDRVVRPAKVTVKS